MDRSPIQTRPTELRYRIADVINDALKEIPYLHSSLKTVMAQVRRYGTVARRLVHVGNRRRLTKDASGSAARSRSDISTGSRVQTGIAGRVELLPFPPLEMRELVGPTELKAFDNPERAPVYPWLPLELYESVFDFGCGCGRVARQMILQRPAPKVYVGIDLHAGMIRWCQNNLQPIAPQFQFLHHDVHNVRFNPGAEKPSMAGFPGANGQFTLVNALSVFTHLTQEQAVYYLRECARILHHEGVVHASWFLFDKSDYPMLHKSDNALYVSYIDPSAAVIFDREWVRATARQFGLTIGHIIPPQVHGHQWLLIMSKKSGIAEAEFPPDTAARGSVPPPMGSRLDAHTIGVHEG